MVWPGAPGRPGFALLLATDSSPLLPRRLGAHAGRGSQRTAQGGAPDQAPRDLRAPSASSAGGSEGSGPAENLPLSPSDVPPRQEEERPVFLGVGGLELVPQPELPLVFQLEADHRLPQGVPVLTDDAQGGTCMHGNGRGVEENR